MDDSVNILIVDDYMLYAAGLSSALKALDGSVQVKEIYSALKALKEIENSDGYDLVLVGIEMPVVNGIDLLLELKARGNATPVVIVSANENTADMKRAMEAGARGYIPKSCTRETMLAAVETVLHGGDYFPDDLPNRIRPRAKTKAQTHIQNQNQNQATRLSLSLSPCQSDILKLIESGKSERQIAEILGISRSALKFYTVGLFRELNDGSRTGSIHVTRQLSLSGMVE